jgi:hypothetical protein
VAELSEIFFGIFNIFLTRNLVGVLESGDMASSPSYFTSPPGRRARYKNEYKRKASPGLFLEGLKGGEKKILPHVEIGSRIF